MKNLISFIGFGEAAFHIANGLRSEGLMEIVAYDVNQDHDKLGEIIRNRAQESGVILADSLEEAYRDSKFIVSLTSAKVAYNVAKGIIPNLKSGQTYIDMNSAAPTLKEEIDSIQREDGVLVCDAAVMTTVPGKGHKVPIFLSGSGAGEFYREMSKYGMNLTDLEASTGASSAIKMFRSVFMKGLPQLMMESMVPAARFGALDILIDSLNEALLGKTIEDLSQVFFARTMIHAERRAKEMSDAVLTLEDMGIDASMSKAIQYKLEQLAKEEYIEVIGPEGDMDFRDAIKILIDRGSEVNEQC